MADAPTPVHEPPPPPVAQEGRISPTGQAVTCVLFFLQYLGPAHLLDTNVVYPWYGRMLLLAPWLVMSGVVFWSRNDRVPCIPALIGVIALTVSCLVVWAGEWVVLGKAPTEADRPEVVNAIVIAGLAVIVTVPMWRGYTGQGTGRGQAGA